MQSSSDDTDEAINNYLNADGDLDMQMFLSLLRR